MLTVKEVEISSQRFPVRYDINALGELESLTGQNTLNGEMNFDIRCMHALAYVGLKHGHKYQYNNVTQFGKTLEEVGAWLPIKSLKLFPPILFEFTKGDEAEEEEEEEEKDKPKSEEKPGE